MISVVIPLYNKESSIQKTIESVLVQTYKDFELIIVDDGSTDNSVNIVECINVNNQFKLIKKSNGGVSSARNEGINNASGDYIAFLDGDDLWEPTYLEEMYKLIHDFPDAGIYGLGIGKKVGETINTNFTKLCNGFRGVVDNIWDNDLMLYWTSSSSCCCRQKLGNIRFNENLTHGEDLDVWLQLMHTGPAVFYNKTLAYYVQDAENRAMNIMPPIHKHIVSVIPNYKLQRMANSSFRKSFDTQMVYFLYEYMFTPYKKEAKMLAALLDCSQLKFTLKFRMYYPRIYKLLMRIKSLIK